MKKNNQMSMIVLVSGLLIAGSLLQVANAVDPNATTGYNAGIEVGQQEFNQELAKDQAAAEDLPGYNSNPPETAYYNSDTPNTAISSGQSMAPTSDAAQVTDQSMQAAEQQGSLLDGTDPIFRVGGPQSALVSAYPGCVDTIGVGPDTLTSEVCTVTPTPTKHTCNKSLTVSVSEVKSCVLGTQQASSSLYALINPKKGWFCNATVTVTCGPAYDGIHQVHIDTQFQGNKYSTYSFDYSHNTSVPGLVANPILGCGYQFYNDGCDATGLCALRYTNGYNWNTVTFQKSKITFQETDTWTNGCASLEKRVVP